ncbi:uncharacterized protein J3R85_004210 [Psidium guajava]|nr:uncharacterized protein J3R85_004210 [Psidium guajava]
MAASFVAQNSSQHGRCKLEAHMAMARAQRSSGHGSSFSARIDLAAMAIRELELELPWRPLA